MPTSQKVSALIVVGLAALGAIYTLVAGNQPLLGLDLQGGVSVVLEPTGDTADGATREVTDESLDLTVELLRSRIDEIGVAEPEISRQGNNIVVGLPGLVEEQEEALDRLRQTAELRFRPVLAGPDIMGVQTLDLDDLEGDTGSDADSDGGTDAEVDAETDRDEAEADDDEQSLVAAGGRFGPVFAAQTTTESTEAEASDTGEQPTEPSTTSEPTETTQSESSDTTTGDDTDSTEGTGDDTEGTGVDDGDGAAPTPGLTGQIAQCFGGDVTADDDDLIDEVVILADDEGLLYCLGPAVLEGQFLTGDMIETASVGLNPGLGWQVNPTFNSGPDGIDRFNEISALCFLGNQEVCPTGQLAVVLDHQVISAPSINAGSFGRDQIVISGGSQNPFEEEEARRLAEALRFGALPLELVAQETRTVSATIGQDVLRSGVIAGLIGLALVALYLLAYYRLAGLVAISGLLLSAALLWTIIAWFGETFGLALSLAGVVGLIVSIGVSTDSNIVYFENVKDSYRAGRRVPTAVERAYESAISTIVKADIVSLIAAVLLYLLTVGAVRGFAFYLGLATILDLIIS
ncbi:MAG: protein translocase subunit SecD, partial [Acidimicrobiales bacterium]